MAQQTARARPARDDVQVLSTNVRQPTQEEATNAAILIELARLGGNLANEDALEFKGNKVILPESMGGNIDAAVSWLLDHKEQQETKHRFSRTFRYRPLDGAHALQSALRKIWGSTGIGGSIQTMFGKIPPMFATIDVGVNETAQVPEGRIMFAPLQADIYVHYTNDAELGPLFELIIEAPRKFRPHIDGLFMAVENELRTGSIYKGKAITGAVIPTFLDLTKVDPEKVIYSEEVMTQLEANVWAVIRHADTLRNLSIELKRAVLLEGPFGTGKTLAAYLTGQVAVQNGWTFVFCRPGQDDLYNAMRTAQLYAPAVVFFEDVDVVAEQGDDPDAVSKLLELFDGISAKNQEVLAVLTTNHVERIQKAMLRPGRLDAVIHIGALDQRGVLRLIGAKVPANLLGELDPAAIGEAMEGFLPAFAAEAIDRTLRYAIARAEGNPTVLTTEDFVEAALGLRRQLQLMEEAAEGTRRPTIDQSFIDLVRQSTHGTRVVDEDDDVVYTLAVNGARS